MTETLVRIFSQRPFEPFTLFLVDGRELTFRHPEQGTFGIRAEAVVLFHPDRRIEVVGTRHIVSIRTVHAGDISDYATESPTDLPNDPE